jgi:hypothetical protein
LEEEVGKRLVAHDVVVSAERGSFMLGGRGLRLGLGLWVQVYYVVGLLVLAGVLHLSYEGLGSALILFVSDCIFTCRRFEGL